MNICVRQIVFLGVDVTMWYVCYPVELIAKVRAYISTKVLSSLGKRRRGKRRKEEENIKKRKVKIFFFTEYFSVEAKKMILKFVQKNPREKQAIR